MLIAPPCVPTCESMNVCEQYTYYFQQLPPAIALQCNNEITLRLQSNQTLLHANIKDADQPAHPHSLIGAFVIR